MVINAADNSGNPADTVAVHVAKDTSPQVADISVSPSAATVISGKSKGFTAAVAVKNGAPQTVTWSVSGAEKPGTSISA